MTHYEWDTSCADVELARLQRGFTGYDNLNFARVLLTAFGRVVKDIHIETGSLLSSATVDPIDTTPQRWSGQISVGGASAGVNNPVRYAASEFFGTSPRHGGPPSHNFYRNLEHIDDDFAGPVSSFISRGRRTPHPEGHVP
jgi:hypothetical protein